MRPSDRTYLLAALFACAFALAYCGIIHFHIPVPRYYPLEHAWRMSKTPGIPSQGWYGMVALAFAMAGAGTAVGALLTRLVGPRLTQATGVVTTLIVVACLLYVLIHEFAHWGNL